MNFSKKVFISYAREDVEAASTITANLEAEGYHCFFDIGKLNPGTNFHGKIIDHLEAADILIFLISPDSITKESYAMWEVSVFRASNPSPNDCTLPIMIRDTKINHIPPYLTAVTILDPGPHLASSVILAIRNLTGKQVSKKHISIQKTHGKKYSKKSVFYALIAFIILALSLSALSVLENKIFSSIKNLEFFETALLAAENILSILGVNLGYVIRPALLSIICAGFVLLFWEVVFRSSTSQNRSAAGRWILGSWVNKSELAWQYQILDVFDSAFDSKVDSFQFFARSLIYTMFGCCASIIIWIIIWSKWVGAYIGINPIIIAILWIPTFVASFIPDYLSLIETKLVIDAMRKSGSRIRAHIFMLYDVFLTFAIISLFVCLSIFMSGRQVFLRGAELGLTDFIKVQESYKGITQASNDMSCIFRGIILDIRKNNFPDAPPPPSPCIITEINQSTSDTSIQNKRELATEESDGINSIKKENPFERPFDIKFHLPAILMVFFFIGTPLGIFSTVLTSAWIWAFSGLGFMARFIASSSRNIAYINARLAGLEPQGYRIIGLVSAILTGILVFASVR